MLSLHVGAKYNKFNFNLKQLLNIYQYIMYMIYIHTVIVLYKTIFLV